MVNKEPLLRRQPRRYVRRDSGWWTNKGPTDRDAVDRSISRANGRRPTSSKTSSMAANVSQTPEDARAAVKYFNKSFIRMSRINVELAQQIEKKSELRPHIAPAVEPTRTQSSKKRSPSPIPQSTTVDNKRVKIQEEPQVETSETTANANADNEKPPVSDADWMRSKTSRLLGLADEDSDQEETYAIRPVQAPFDKPSPEEPAQQPTPPLEDESHQEEDDIDRIKKTGRLFIRNLWYGADEEHLSEFFSQDGPLNEVCLFCSVSAP